MNPLYNAGRSASACTARMHNRGIFEGCAPEARDQPRRPTLPSSNVRRTIALLDDLVRPRQHRRRDRQADFPGGAKVQGKLNLVVILNREILRWRPTQDALHVP